MDGFDSVVPPGTQKCVMSVSGPFNFFNLTFLYENYWSQILLTEQNCQTSFFAWTYYEIIRNFTLQAPSSTVISYDIKSDE